MIHNKYDQEPELFLHVILKLFENQSSKKIDEADIVSLEKRIEDRKQVSFYNFLYNYCRLLDVFPTNRTKHQRNIWV